MTKHRFGTTALLAGLLAAMIGVSCAAESTDYPAGSPPDPTGNPSEGGSSGGGCRTAQVQALFSANCTGCHGSGGAAGLDLTGSLEARLANKASPVCSGKVLVSPGNAAGSYLLDKLQGDATCGVPMPKGKPQLDATSINCVADWIDGLPAGSNGPGGGEDDPPGGQTPGGGW